MCRKTRCYKNCKSCFHKIEKVKWNNTHDLSPCSGWNLPCGNSNNLDCDCSTRSHFHKPDLNSQPLHKASTSTIRSPTVLKIILFLFRRKDKQFALHSNVAEVTKQWQMINALVMDFKQKGSVLLRKLRWKSSVKSSVKELKRVKENSAGVSWNSWRNNVDFASKYGHLSYDSYPRLWSGDW